MYLPKPVLSGPTRLRVFLVLAVMGASGCRSGGDLTAMMDEASRDRVNAAPGDGTLLVSVRADSLPDPLPGFGDDARALARTGHAVLLEVRVGKLDSLSALPNATKAAVWGPGEAFSKLDPWFRPRLLEAWSEAPEETLTVIARFTGSGEDLRERLRDAGAEPRTIAGGVATLAATPGALFRILNMKDLAGLRGPQKFRPLDDR